MDEFLERNKRTANELEKPANVSVSQGSILSRGIMDMQNGRAYDESHIRFLNL